MLTPQTLIDCPDLIRGGRSPWRGTIEQAFHLDDQLWDHLGGLLADCAPLPEDQDEERDLAQMLKDLAPHFDDLDLLRDLMDDPNVRILDGPRPPGAQRMPAGELKSVREHLGLTGEALAGLLRVTPRTVRDWESGREKIPYKVRAEIEALEAYTTRCVDQVIEALTASHDPDTSIIVYRTDEEMRSERPDLGQLTARWWRHVAYRAALAVPGTPILLTTEIKH